MQRTNYKLIALVLIIFNILSSLHVYANGDDNKLIYDIEDIEKITVSPMISGGYYPYDYTTTDNREIKYIAYILNSFDARSMDVPGFVLHANYYFISVYNKNNEISNIVITLYQSEPDEAYVDCSDRNLYYKIKRVELNKFLSFIYGLKSGGINLDSHNSVDYTFDWQYPETVIAIEKDLFPKMHRLGYSENISRLETCQLVLNFIELNKSDVFSNDIQIMKDPFLDCMCLFGVKELYSLGITEGKGDNEFCPYDNITREEFAKILSKTYHIINSGNKITNSGSTYTDSERISDWAKEYVDEMTSLGVLNGRDGGSFDPQGAITKEEVIISLLRLDAITNNDK